MWLRPTVVTSPQRSKSPESSISCSTGDAFPHHSRAIPELPNPFQEAEFSRLRQARSICRISRIAILTEKPEQGSAGGSSRDAGPTRSERNFDSPKAPSLAFNRSLPIARSQMRSYKSAAKLPAANGKVPADRTGAWDHCCIRLQMRPTISMSHSADRWLRNIQRQTFRREPNRKASKFE